MLVLSQGLLSRIVGTLLTSSPPWDPITHKAFREGLFSQLLHLILSLEYFFVPPRDSSRGNLVHVIARVPRRCEFSIHPGLSCCRFYLSRCDTILQLRSKSIHYHVKVKGFFIYGEPFYLIEAVLGQLKTTLISPKNLPSPIVSNTIGSSCSETTSTVPRWMKYICRTGS